MTNDLTEAEMRRALFGSAEISKPIKTPAVDDEISKVVIVPATAAPKKKKVVGYIPRLKVTLQVGNEFEGEMQTMAHEVDTLSTLLAEQEATKAARKKFRYVEVVSIAPAKQG
jgi:hypothetical protein